MKRIGKIIGTILLVFGLLFSFVQLENQDVNATWCNPDRQDNPPECN